MRKCRHCGTRFIPTLPAQASCGIPCAIELAKKALAQQNRKEAAAHRREAVSQRRQNALARKALLTDRDYLKSAQKAFNSFIRLRDKDKPCICCVQPMADKALTGGGYDAGHYRSTGSAPWLRFTEDNCHGQRKVCNHRGSGRAVDYRIGLIQRIGLDRVEALERDNQPHKFTRQELIDLAALYKAKARAITRQTTVGEE